jgi:hypothetical protein
MLPGCFAPVDRVEILVDTVPPGASCTLSRLGQPIATAEPTPAIALVDPGAGEIAVLCRRRGFEDAMAALAEPPAAPHFDLLFGPPPFDYGHRVSLALKPLPSAAASR